MEHSLLTQLNPSSTWPYNRVVGEQKDSNVFYPSERGGQRQEISVYDDEYGTLAKENVAESDKYAYNRSHPDLGRISE